MSSVDVGPGEAPGPRWHAWVAPSLVAVVAGLVFGTALLGDFVWDDAVMLPPTAKLLQADLRSLFTAKAFAFARIDIPADGRIYRPVTVLALSYLARVCGGSPTAWHVVPIALHVANSLLVFWLARRLTRGATAAALAAALLFAVLPCHVEAVAWISAFVHPLTTLLALGAVHAQLSHARGGKSAWLVVGVVGATAAALASEGALVVPALLIALVWVERQRRPPASVWIGYALAVVGPLFIRSRVMAATIPLELDGAALLRAASFGAAYVRDLLSPWPSAPYATYPRAGVAGLATWLLLPLIAGGAVVTLRRLPAELRPRALYAIGWIALGLAPIAAAGASWGPFYAPRALYLPSVGLALLAAAVLARWRPDQLARMRGLAVAGVLGGLAVGNVAAAEWRDDLTVHRRLLQADPEASRVHLSMSNLLDRAGRRAEALEHLDLARRYAVEPRDRLNAEEGMAIHLGEEGRIAEAGRLLMAVVEEDPSRASAWMNLGNVALLERDPRRAREYYQRSLAIAPNSVEAAYNLALTLEALGESAEAAAARARAAQLAAGAR